MKQTSWLKSAFSDQRMIYPYEMGNAPTAIIRNIPKVDSSALNSCGGRPKDEGLMRR